MTLVERLRERWERIDGAAARKIDRVLKERREAADRIVALEEALKPFANLGAALPEHYPHHNARFLGPGHPRFWHEIDPAHIWAARTALYGRE